MRTVDYISPSGIQLYDESVEGFYERYLADNRAPRDPQLLVMAVGSAFDAYIKSYLYKELKIGNDPQFELRTLFEAQVEEANRAKAWDIGDKVFKEYVRLGGAADLLVMLGDCLDCRMEFELRGAVKREDCSVILLGKPDLYFTNRDGVRVILDWKVNGYFSKSRPSPKRGYLNVLCDEGVFKRKQHKDVHVGDCGGVRVNIAHPLELVDSSWARQLAIYGWLLGEEVGGEFVVGIDQLVCCDEHVFGIAQHRCTVGKVYQEELYRHCCDIWDRIVSGWFFREMSLEDSKARCDILDKAGGELTVPEFDRER